MMGTKKNLKYKQRGFSLGEFAIVLGVIGMVAGGIWSLSGTMQDDLTQEKFSEQLSILAKASRAAYLGKASIDSTNPAVVMPILANMNAFPSDMTQNVSGVVILHSPWGLQINPLAAASPYNSIYICGWRAGMGAATSASCDLAPGAATANVPLLAIEVLIPTTEACIKAVMRNSDPATFPGLVDVVINGARATALHSLPVGLTAFAQNYCTPNNSTVSPAIVVDFVIRPNPQGS